MNVEIKIIDKRMADLLPKYATPGSAGLDLRACMDEDLELGPNQGKLVGTGLAIFLADRSHVGLLLPRSGSGHKRGIVLGNLTGVIDSDFQGELKLSLWNRTNERQVVKAMEEIAQLLIVPVVHASFTVVESFNATQRGEGGFGSTREKR